MKRCWLAGAVLLGLCGGQIAAADDSQIITINGVQYRETTTRQKRQVVELQPQSRTYHQTQYKAEQQTVAQAVMVPVNETVWEVRQKSSWNPFAAPQYEYVQVPRVRYEQRVQQVPVTVMKPETVEVQVTEQVPVARLVDVDVKTRVALNAVQPNGIYNNNSQLANQPWQQNGRISLDGQPNASLRPLDGGASLPNSPSSIGQRENRLDWKR